MLEAGWGICLWVRPLCFSALYNSVLSHFTCSVIFPQCLLAEHHFKLLLFYLLFFLPFSPPHPPPLLHLPHPPPSTPSSPPPLLILLPSSTSSPPPPLPSRFVSLFRVSWRGSMGSCGTTFLSWRQCSRHWREKWLL